jgi:hypothetical protein
MSHGRFYSEAASRAWHAIGVKVRQTFGGGADVSRAGELKLRVYNDQGWGLAYHDLPEMYV